MVIIRHVKKVVNGPAQLDGPGDHECLELKEFAKRVGRAKQTVYKWAQYNPKKNFPPRSLLKDPTGRHFLVDWDVYKKAIVVVN